MRRRLVVRDLAIVVALVALWWLAWVTVPAGGDWHAVRLGADVAITLLVLVMLFVLWRHVTGQETTGDGGGSRPTSGAGRRPAGKPQSLTNGTAPHH